MELLQVYFRDTSNILHLKTVNLEWYFSKYVNRFELDLVWNKCILNMFFFFFTRVELIWLGPVSDHLATSQNTLATIYNFLQHRVSQRCVFSIDLNNVLNCLLICPDIKQIKFYNLNFLKYILIWTQTKKYAIHIQQFFTFTLQQLPCFCIYFYLFKCQRF